MYEKGKQSRDRTLVAGGGGRNSQPQEWLGADGHFEDLSWEARQGERTEGVERLGLIPTQQRLLGEVPRFSRIGPRGTLGRLTADRHGCLRLHSNAEGKVTTRRKLTVLRSSTNQGLLMGFSHYLACHSEPSSSTKVGDGLGRLVMIVGRTS